MSRCARRLEPHGITGFTTPGNLRPLRIRVFGMRVVRLINRLIYRLRRPVTTLVSRDLVGTHSGHSYLLPSAKGLSLTNGVLLDRFRFDRYLAGMRQTFGVFTSEKGRRDFRAGIGTYTIAHRSLVILTCFFLRRGVGVRVTRHVPFSYSHLGVH